MSRLAEWGADTVFGFPGDGINGIMEGLRRYSDRVRWEQMVLGYPERGVRYPQPVADFAAWAAQELKGGA